MLLHRNSIDIKEIKSTADRSRQCSLSCCEELSLFHEKRSSLANHSSPLLRLSGLKLCTKSCNGCELDHSEMSQPKRCLPTPAYAEMWMLQSWPNVPFLQDMLERCMARDHRSRPRFAELVGELKKLVQLEQQGINMDEYSVPVPVSQPAFSSKWRSISMGSRLAKPSLPQVIHQSVQAAWTICMTCPHPITCLCARLQKCNEVSYWGSLMSLWFGKGSNLEFTIKAVLCELAEAERGICGTGFGRSESCAEAMSDAGPGIKDAILPEKALILASWCCPGGGLDNHSIWHAPEIHFHIHNYSPGFCKYARALAAELNDQIVPFVASFHSPKSWMGA